MWKQAQGREGISENAKSAHGGSRVWTGKFGSKTRFLALLRNAFPKVGMNELYVRQCGTVGLSNWWCYERFRVGDC